MDREISSGLSAESGNHAGEGETNAHRYNSPMPQGEYLQYGGQAIIEGVMMRSPRHVAVAVLAPDKEIVLQCEPIEKTWIGRQKWLHKPFLRGTWALLDAMTLGVRAMKFASKVLLDPKYEVNQPKKDPKSASAEPVALEEPKQPSANGNEESLDQFATGQKQVKSASEKIQGTLVGLTIVISLLFGLALFHYAPNLIAASMKGRGITNPIHINMVTEAVKFIFLFGYIIAISQLPDIRRVFQFHGAEHKAINTLEADQELTIENCKRQTRLHPRCGTSFMVIVFIIGAIIFTFMPKPEIVGNLVLTSLLRFLVEIPLLPVIAGISYEVIRYAGKMKSSLWVNTLLKPGLWTQLITTREPDEEQIQVALASLMAVVDAERKGQESKPEPALEENEDALMAEAAQLSVAGEG